MSPVEASTAPRTAGSPKPESWLFVMVPGMAVAESGTTLSRLTDGLKAFADTRNLDLGEAGGRPGAPRQLTFSDAQRSARIELAESYWSDLRPRLSAEAGLRKCLGGLSLLAFWLSSPKVWAKSLGSKYMFVNAVGTLLLIVVWYYGAVATLLDASGSDTEALKGLGLESFGPKLAEWGSMMGGWRVWLAASVVAGILPMLTVVDVAHASAAYLTNRDRLASRVKARLEKVLYAAFERDFDRIVVVAHSFGVAVAVDVLADLDEDQKRPVSLVTLGGSLGLFRARSPRLDAAYSRLVKDPALTSWIDFWSDQDWFGTPALETPETRDNPKFSSRALDVEVSFLRKLSGESHGLYFSEPDVYEALLEV